eukprot:g11596.t1
MVKALRCINNFNAAVNIATVSILLLKSLLHHRRLRQKQQAQARGNVQKNPVATLVLARSLTFVMGLVLVVVMALQHAVAISCTTQAKVVGLFYGLFNMSIYWFYLARLETARALHTQPSKKWLRLHLLMEIFILAYQPAISLLEMFAGHVMVEALPSGGYHRICFWTPSDGVMATVFVGDSVISLLLLFLFLHQIWTLPAPSSEKYKWLAVRNVRAAAVIQVSTLVMLGGWVAQQETAKLLSLDQSPNINWKERNAGVKSLLTFSPLFLGFQIIPRLSSFGMYVISTHCLCVWYCFGSSTSPEAQPINSVEELQAVPEHRPEAKHAAQEAVASCPCAQKGEASDSPVQASSSHVETTDSPDRNIRRHVETTDSPDRNIRRPREELVSSMMVKRLVWGLTRVSEAGSKEENGSVTTALQRPLRSFRLRQRVHVEKKKWRVSNERYIHEQRKRQERQRRRKRFDTANRSGTKKTQRRKRRRPSSPPPKPPKENSPSHYSLSNRTDDMNPEAFEPLSIAEFPANPAAGHAWAESEGEEWIKQLPSEYLEQSPSDHSLSLSSTPRSTSSDSPSSPSVSVNSSDLPHSSNVQSTSSDSMSSPSVSVNPSDRSASWPSPSQNTLLTPARSPKSSLRVLDSSYPRPAAAPLLDLGHQHTIIVHSSPQGSRRSLRLLALVHLAI